MRHYLTESSLPWGRLSIRSTRHLPGPLMLDMQTPRWHRSTWGCTVVVPNSMLRLGNLCLTVVAFRPDRLS